MAASQTYRKLYTRLWRHRGFMSMNTKARLVTLYLLTGPQTNTIGCYTLSLALMSEDLDVSKAEAIRLVQNVCKMFDWEWDELERQVWIPSWPKWNPQISPNQGKAWRNEIQGLPECKAKVSLTLAFGMATGSQPEANAIQNKKKNKEAETEAEVVRPSATQPVAIRADTIHGRRNFDLMTYGPIALWASQFRDEILPLVASHFAGDRDAAEKPARAWVAEMDELNQSKPPLSGELAKPKLWWSVQARERWALSESAVSASEVCPGCGNPEGLCADIKVCNRRWLDSQQKAQQEA